MVSFLFFLFFFFLFFFFLAHGRITLCESTHFARGERRIGFGELGINLKGFI